jgi:hypothetical protein
MRKPKVGTLQLLSNPVRAYSTVNFPTKPSDLSCQSRALRRVGISEFRCGGSSGCGTDSWRRLPEQKRGGWLDGLVVISDAEYCIGKPVTERLIILKLLEELSIIGEKCRNDALQCFVVLDSCVLPV